MKPNPCTKYLPLAAAAMLVAAISGCGRDTVQVYQVSTNDAVTAAAPPAPATPMAPPAMASGSMPMSMPAGLAAPDNSGLPPLKYKLPDGWKEKALTTMRVASFSAQGDGHEADISVVPMGGMAGGDLANVTRWRGQVGLGPVSEQDLPKLSEQVEIAGQAATLYDFGGTAPGSGDPERIIAAAQLRGDTTWFFKMTGDATFVESQKPAFINFLKSLEFGGLPAPSTMDMSQLPPSHPPIGGMAAGMVTAPAAPAGDKPTWSVPAGWQEGPLTQFLVAKYLISGAGGAKAEVNVSPLAGDGGGMAMNLTRWRGQLGLGPPTDADVANLPTIDASGAKATVVEFSGTNPRTSQPAKLIGVILPMNGQTWFYKLMGDPDLVLQQKDALIQFVKSAKYP
jgi:hypothetical protein